jgi:hypothetical protein
VQEEFIKHYLDPVKSENYTMREEKEGMRKPHLVACRHMMPRQLRLHGSTSSAI